MLFVLLCAAPVSGEMVLLLHWSLLNYAAVVKILKKHGKCCLVPAGGQGTGVTLLFRYL
jgi:hypothetical protein